MPKDKIMYILGILRLEMGWVFLWAFLDKLFGLGFSTSVDKAWISGNSPTSGFLRFGTKGPFAEFYQGLAGNSIIDWLFMLGLAFVGICLILGILVKIGSFIAILMLLLIYSASALFPEHNPFLDEHIIYATLLVLLAFSDSGSFLGLGKKWRKISLVKKYPVLE